jgi:sugar lactone lactonase YvrE
MSVPPVIRSFIVLLLLMLGLGPGVVQAQGSTPVVNGASNLEVVASGLTNPRGMTWGADGTLFVSLAGSGGNSPATEDAPTTAAIGPFLGGMTGAVASIGTDGCPVLVAGNLPSTRTGMGEILGAEDVAILSDQMYVAVDGGGPVHGNADAPSGVYRLLADGSSEVVADLSAWVRANPVAELPEDFDPDAAGYSMVADQASGLLWVSDPNSGQILSVTPDGVITRIADLSAGHPVPTKMVADPQGGVYVGTLTAVPFADGTAKVVHVAADGTATDVWTGLTVVTDVAVGADGSLYAIEMSTGNLQQPPFLQPGSGKLVHQTGPDSMDVVAEGLMFPIAMDMGGDGALYLAVPGIGADNGEGAIVRLPLDGSAATPSAGGATMGSCSALPETLTMPATPAASPVAG